LQWAAASRDLHNAITSVTSASGFHGASHPGQKIYLRQPTLCGIR
jgi:hypothetical protein